MNVPPAIAKAMEPLTTAAPLSVAMERLVVSEPADPARLEVAAEVVQNPVIQANPTLCAGIWLYVDALDRSHTISQGVKDATGSFWHGIMHRREGDFSNSHYWFNRTGDHPAMADISGYDPHAFIDQVEDRSEADSPVLVAMQRQEWQTLFEWCANR